MATNGKTLATWPNYYIKFIISVSDKWESQSNKVKSTIFAKKKKAKQMCC